MLSHLRRTARRLGRRLDLCFRPSVELLEVRDVPAPITGGTGPGGLFLNNGTSALQLWYDTTNTGSLTTTFSRATEFANFPNVAINVSGAAGGTQLFATNSTLGDPRLMPGGTIRVGTTDTYTISALKPSGSGYEIDTVQSLTTNYTNANLFVQTVSSLGDLSGAGNNANQGSPTFQPVLLPSALNNQQALHFNAFNLATSATATTPTSSLLLPTFAFSTYPLTVFVVDQYSVDNTGTAAHGRTVNSRTTNWLIGKHGTAGGLNGFYANNWATATSGPGPDGQNLAVDFTPIIGDGTVTSSLLERYYRNGFDVTNGTPSASNPPPGFLQIGGGYGLSPTTERSNFDMSTLIVYTQVLNTAQRVIIDNYLSAELGIALNGDDKYAGDTAALGKYKLDVFGVGNDTTGTTPGSATTAGAAGFGIENTALTPGQYILAGHNTPVNSLVTSNITGNIKDRWNRVWYVDQTGSPGTSTFTFDLSDGGGLPANPGGYDLLYSSKNPATGGTFTALNLTPTIIGSKIIFTVPAALVQDGYFTLGDLSPVADMSITKTDNSGGTVSPGQAVTYTILVTNNGPTAASGISVTDVVPAALKGVTWSANPSAGVTGAPTGMQSGNSINIANLTFPLNGTLLITVTGTYTGTTTGSLSNTATVVVPPSVFDPNLANNTATVSDNAVPPPPPPPPPPAIIATGADAGALPQVNVYNANGQLKFSLMPFPITFRGGVRTAVGDINGDGVNDIVCAAGPGALPAVEIYDGATGQLMKAFFAINGPSPFGLPQSGTAALGNTSFIGLFSGGLTVACGDVNGDGFADVVVGADKGGGPLVQVYDFHNGKMLGQFYAFPTFFTGGVRVAVGDLNGTGGDEIICGAGPGGLAQVNVFSGVNFTLQAAFFAYPGLFTGGLYVASGDVNGDGKADIITGAGAGAGPEVLVYDGATAGVLEAFFATDPHFTGGVRVGTADLNGDRKSDIITSLGPAGFPTVTSFDSTTLSILNGFYAYSPVFRGGVNMGAG